MLALVKFLLLTGGPGLLVTGLVGLSSTAENAAYVLSIIAGMFVVALAGIFTIRSNVAKIWREQAEGEKARNDNLGEQIVGMRKVIDEQRVEKERLVGEMSEYKQRDQGAVLELLVHQHKETMEILAVQHKEILIALKGSG